MPTSDTFPTVKQILSYVLFLIKNMFSNKKSHKKNYLFVFAVCIA